MSTPVLRTDEREWKDEGVNGREESMKEGGVDEGERSQWEKGGVNGMEGVDEGEKSQGRRDESIGGGRSQ